MSFQDLSVIIVAGGTSSRFGSGNKLLKMWNGLPIFVHSVKTFSRLIFPEKIVLVVPAAEQTIFEQTLKQYGCENSVIFAPGGSCRSQSVQSGLAVLPNSDGYVAIHDAARPQITEETIGELLKSARIHGGAIPGKPVTDTLKLVDENNLVQRTVPRQNLFAVETPQVFDLQRLRLAYQQYPDTDFTDDAAVFSLAGNHCCIYHNPEPNLKITYRADLQKLS